MINENSIILITGASGGIAKSLIREFIILGVKKIYATGIEMGELEELKSEYGDIINPVILDVTDSESIKNCLQTCQDTNILINNAGVELKIPFISDKSSRAALFEMKVNYIGMVDMTNQSIPILQKNDGATIVNILSLASLATVKRLGHYCSSKASSHIFTQSIRKELETYNIRVVGVYPGYVNTDMVPEKTVTKKTEPFEIARNIVSGIINEQEDIFPDAVSQKYVMENPIKMNYLD